MRLLTLKSILVATDLDPTSLAIRTGARLASLAGAGLHVLHVAEQPDADAKTRLEQQLESVAGVGSEPDTVQVAIGPPAALIVEQAIGLDADVIVLGPHRGTRSGEIFGSTATRVVRTARCPCLVATTELRLPLERVLAPIDLSDVAGGALAVALSWTSALRPRDGTAQLTALHVSPPPVSAAVEQSVEQEVRRARERAGGAARVEITQSIASGSAPADTILQVASTQRADLVVMGTRGIAGAASGLGSVSAAVARATPCSLLLVPPATWVAHAD